MKKRWVRSVLWGGLLVWVSALPVRAQFVVSDPGNTVVNSIHSGISTLVKVLQDNSFKKLVGNVEDLAKVSSAVKNLDRGVKVVQKASRLAQSLSKISQTVSVDRHISPAEYRLILDDMRGLSTASTDLLKDMRSATATGMLKMDDNGRVAIIDKVDQRLDQIQNMVSTYLSRIMRLSNTRATTLKDRQLTTQLYGAATNQINGLYAGAGSAVPFFGTGHLAYEQTEEYNDKSVLDTYANSSELSNLQKRQEEMQYRSMQYSSELQLEEHRAKRDAAYMTFAPGGMWVPLPKNKKADPQLFMNAATGQMADEQEMDIMIQMTTRKLLVDRNIAQSLRTKWGLDQSADMSQINTAGIKEGMANAMYTAPSRGNGVDVGQYAVYQPGVFTPKEPDPIKIDVYIPPVTVILEDPKPTVTPTPTPSPTGN